MHISVVERKPSTQNFFCFDLNLFVLLSKFVMRLSNPVVSVVGQGAVKGTQKRKTAGDSPLRKSPKKWAADEDTLLVKAIEQHGEKCWRGIARMVGSKDHDSCCM
jgi:hypothetical protein